LTQLPGVEITNPVGSVTPSGDEYSYRFEPTVLIAVRLDVVQTGHVDISRRMVVGTVFRFD